MKTILKIFTILAVISLVAGGIYLLVEKTSLVSNLGGGERPEFAAGERPQMSEDGERGGREHKEASLTRGFGEVGKTLVKISIITIFVLGIQFAFKQAKRLTTQRANLS